MQDTAAGNILCGQFKRRGREAMVHLTIDGQPVEVEEGTTISRRRKFVSTFRLLSHHEDLSIKAVCRICVVEVEGQRLLSDRVQYTCFGREWSCRRHPRRY